jgi:hypothetical protein
MFLFSALDGKGRASLPGQEVREHFWNIKNHPNPCTRSESLETLFRAITHSRCIDNERVKDAFGDSLHPFVDFVLYNLIQHKKGSLLASAVPLFDVCRLLMVRSWMILNFSCFVHVVLCNNTLFQSAPIVATLAFDRGILHDLLDMDASPERNSIIQLVLSNRFVSVQRRNCE